MAALRAAVFPLSANNRRGGHFLPPPPPSSARVKVIIPPVAASSLVNIVDLNALYYFWLLHKSGGAFDH